MKTHNPTAHNLTAAPSAGYGWLLLGLLVAGSTTVALICYFGFAGQRGIVAIPLLATTSFLCSLLGFWGAFGRRLLRFVPVIALPLVFSFALGWRHEIIHFICYLGGITSIVLVTGLTLRLLAGKLTRDATNNSDALQFDLRHLFIATTIIAGTIGVLRLVISVERMGNLRDVVGIITALVLATSLGAIVGVWAAFAQQLTPVRLTVLACASIASACTGLVLNDGLDFWLPIIVMQQMLTIGALLCLRAEGFRFVKH